MECKGAFNIYILSNITYVWMDIEQSIDDNLFLLSIKIIRFTFFFFVINNVFENVFRC